ncbi:MAG: lipid-A-disaccharide synthase, partial [Chlamydiae bacterium]|nr:lipid-A-disaccharide synthase [Chlamydiota bacterium]
MSSLKPSCDLFIFVGEPSGDALGADLLRALFEQNPHLSITAVAGPGMRRHPISTLYPMEDFQVMGFWEVLKNLRKLTHLFKKIVS